MIVIFLDIDGVLRTHDSDIYWESVNKKTLKGCERLFSNDCVKFLNEVTFLTKAKIVITSNWRLNNNLDELRKIFKDRGVEGEIIDKTILNSRKFNSPLVLGHRGIEIKHWLNINKPDNYIVIDDQISDILEYIPKENVVRINPMKGITDDDVNSIISIIL